MSCNNTPCTCSTPCPPTPCTDGCLIDVTSACVTLASDITIAEETIVKGTELTDVLTTLSDAISGNITITTADVKTKISANDTTNGYLEDKLKVRTSTFPGLEIVKANPAGNEELKIGVKKSTYNGDNTLQILTDGLYVPPAAAATPITVTMTDGDTINFTQTTGTPNYEFTAEVIVDSDPSNILQSGSNGLFVPPYTGTSISVAPVDTSSIDTVVSLVGSTYNVGSNLRLDPSSTASVSITSAGLKVDSALTGGTSITPVDTDSFDCVVTPVTGGYQIGGNVVIKPGTNALTSTSTGLYVAPPTLTFGVGDTNSIDMTLTGSTITSDLIHQNSNSTTLTVPNSSGLKVDLNKDIISTSGTTGAGTNMLDINTNGVYVPVYGPNTSCTLASGDISLTVNTNPLDNGEFYATITYTGTTIDYDNLVYTLSYTDLAGSTITLSGTMATQQNNVEKVLMPHFDEYKGNTSNTVTLNIWKKCATHNTDPYSTGVTKTVVRSATGLPIDVWTAIPNGWFSGAVANGSTGAYYKISRDRKSLYFRGRVDVTVAANTATTTTINATFLDLTTVSAYLNTLTSLSGTFDYYSMCEYSASPNVTSPTLTKYFYFNRSGMSVILTGQITNTTGSTVTSATVNISNLVIH